MTLRPLLRRFGTLSQLIWRNPQALLHLPRFCWRMSREGLPQTLVRLRALSDPLRFAQDYPHWLTLFHTLSPEERSSMQSWAQGLADPPRIAVLMPVFNPRPEWLQQAIDSVRDQLYPHWQLCIADDCSTDPKIRPLLEAAMADDPRIHVTFRERNGHISASSNSALELVDAPWVALLDHDDLLPEDALIWVARAIAQSPQARLFYSDEDKLGPDGKRLGPYFKSGWNPVLMEGQNMFSHLGVYATELIRSVGGFREGYEGSQDYDLVLRCSDRLQPEQIVRIPRVLYHWRVHAESTAGGSKAKPYAQIAAEKALTDHFERCGLPLKQLTCLPQGFRAQLHSPQPRPLVSIVIPTRNGLAVLRPCLNSLLEKTDYAALEVLVVDNGSDDPATLRFLEHLQLRDQRVKVLRDPSPFNYSALNNRAVREARGELICLLNNDIEVIQADWLEEMVSQLQRPGVAAVGAKLLFPNRKVQHAGVFLGLGGVAAHGHRGFDGGERGYVGRANLAQEVSAVTAACLLVRRSAWEQVGGLDAEHLAVAFNDVDFCLRLREVGHRIVFTPFAVLLHHESVSRGDDFTPEKAERFQREEAWMHQRWSDQLQNDPYYNPNLTVADSNFSLAWPPRLERWTS
jgi:glycosyltransferase involved in cell wall biosynthesis